MKKTLDKYLKDEQDSKYKDTKDAYREQRRSLGKPRNIQIAVLGDGFTGLDIVRTLSSMEPVYDYTRITKILLYSSDPDRSELKIDFPLNPKIKVEYRSYDELKTKKNEAHITVVTRDNYKLNGGCYLEECLSRREPPKRLILGKNNIEKIIETAELMQDYEGLVLMVSNHVNLLSHVFQIYSRLDPRQIVGLSHTDTYRLKEELEKRIMLNTEGSRGGELLYLLKAIEAFVIGLHDINMVPVFSEAYVLGGININRIDFFKENTPHEIYKAVLTRGFEQFLALGRLPSPAAAACEVISAVLDERSCVSNAIYIDFNEPIFTDHRAHYSSLIPNRGLWMGLPHFFWDFKAELLPRGEHEELLQYVPDQVMEWFSRLHPRDKEKFFEGAAKLDEILRGWEHERLISYLPIEKITQYYFVGDTEREKTLSARIREELTREREEFSEIISEASKKHDPEKIRQALASGGLDESAKHIIEEAEKEKRKQEIRKRLMKKSEEEP